MTADFAPPILSAVIDRRYSSSTCEILWNGLRLSPLKKRSLVV